MKIFKIFKLEEYTSFLKDKKFKGNEHDQRDGFIHLCTQDQLETVVNKYYKNIEHKIVEINPDIYKEMKWEKASDLKLYPHLYRELNIQDTLIE